MSIDNQKERYTTTKEDIAQAEKIVKDSIGNYLKREKFRFARKTNKKDYQYYFHCVCCIFLCFADER